ncbi:hypothetical protein J2S09_001220 [Bacillus fengqiuensis]|nr:hypothetical protein [Bacillus fengqiuensis]
MYIYIIIYVFLFLLTLKEITVKKFKKLETRIILFILLLFFSIFSGIRYGIGRDYYTYLNIFRGLQTLNDFEYLEPGFRLIISLIKRLGFPDISLFFIFAFISLFFLFKGINKNSNYPFLSVFIYTFVFFIGYTFNVMRQGIVMSLFVYLLSDIQQRNSKKVIFLSLLGMTIHYSAIFIIIGYYFYAVKISRKVYIIMTVILLAVIAVNDFLTSSILAIIPSFIETKISLYMENFQEGIDIAGILQRLLLLAPFIIFYHQLIKSDERFEGIFRLYYLGFIFYSLFSFQGLFATRINMFYRILEIILIPFLLKIKINKYVKLLILYIVIIWATVLYIQELRQPVNFPFRTIFQTLD